MANVTDLDVNGHEKNVHNKQRMHGASGVIDVLFKMTISLVTDATRHAGSGTIGTILFSE